jgi:peptidoglycan/xylan/chitin deacetylase (PgdA/CDA1 family)
MELRSDDVLQIRNTTIHQNYRLQEKTLYEWFVWSDYAFEKYNFKCTLAVLAEGIQEQSSLYKDWVRYIKRNSHRYVIEMHGLNHVHPNTVERGRLTKELREAKKIIENTFECKVTTWYTPFGRRYANPYGKEICDEIGIQYDKIFGKMDTIYAMKSYRKNKKFPYEQANFHFWHKEQVLAAEQIICLLQENNLNNGSQP